MSNEEAPALNLYYDDVEIGGELTTPAHVVTYEDILKFADVTLDHHPLHVDEEYCKKTKFGRPIAHGLYGLSLMEGLKTKLKMYETTSIASLGWDKVRFKAPIFPGDEVHVRVVFATKRDSSKPGRGVVTESVLLINQNDDVVTEAEHATLLIKRGYDETGAPV
ncbi:MAG: monoamine oxidase [Rhodospirillales bacterium]|jgi:acyl dehydratase|nr:monoamine oxidase [Rhodospirillales bacterium]